MVDEAVFFLVFWQIADIDSRFRKVEQLPVVALQDSGDVLRVPGFALRVPGASSQWLKIGSDFPGALPRVTESESQSSRRLREQLRLRDIKVKRLLKELQSIRREFQEDEVAPRQQEKEALRQR